MSSEKKCLERSDIIAQSPIISVAPIRLSTAGREHDLQVRVSAPVIGDNLPIVLFAHGFASSMDAYAPLVHYWAARGFVVIQPTFLDSRTLASYHHTDHQEAVKAYLANPRSATAWRQRVADMKCILDQLNYIESAVPGLVGRLDRSCIAAAGHSFGAHTVGMLLGARVIKPDGSLDDDMSDVRIKAGILLSAGGSGGDALSQFGKNHFPYLEQTFTGLTKPIMVVAGDQDHSPLTVRGPEWFTEVYQLASGADTLITLFGGEHMLGGISGYLVRETTDEDPDRVDAVRSLSWAYLKSIFDEQSTAWEALSKRFSDHDHPIGRIDTK
ncbi:chlorophyllase [Mucilaginibacter sp. Bleaf8]|uniref:alpha/beta hydrolase family protein n=1 Tax=Mucilaginibacter sp. Bleaf8 TaxID=2834430 RepID=UPI001BCD84FD|nr:chlorophyllase [Mucilaginibacter sp. Bleaf8]MBS7564752.1 chlorophyllase [Mucilaginibacter sp. Bleaf8]